MASSRPRQPPDLTGGRAAQLSGLRGASVSPRCPPSAHPLRVLVSSRPWPALVRPPALAAVTAAGSPGAQTAACTVLLPAASGCHPTPCVSLLPGDPASRPAQRPVVGVLAGIPGSVRAADAWARNAGSALPHPPAPCWAPGRASSCSGGRPADPTAAPGATALCSRDGGAPRSRSDVHGLRASGGCPAPVLPEPGGVPWSVLLVSQHVAERWLRPVREPLERRAAGVLTAADAVPVACGPRRRAGMSSELSGPLLRAPSSAGREARPCRSPAIPSPRLPRGNSRARRDPALGADAPLGTRLAPGAPSAVTLSVPRRLRGPPRRWYPARCPRPQNRGHREARVTGRELPCSLTQRGEGRSWLLSWAVLPPQLQGARWRHTWTWGPLAPALWAR